MGENTTLSTRLYDREDFEIVLNFMENNKDIKTLFKNIGLETDSNDCFDIEIKLTRSYR